MTTSHEPDSHEPELTDELLSAYIDNAVTPAERHRVEQAASDDPDVAWRLQSLQMTVQLLHELPALALPRSFVLTPEQMGETAADSPVTAPPPVAQPPGLRRAAQPAQPGFWARLGEGWRAFWSSGSPALRNAMATSLVLLFVFLAAPRMLTAPFGVVHETALMAPVLVSMTESPESMAESAAAGVEESAQTPVPASAQVATDGAVTQSADQAAGDDAAAKGAAPDAAAAATETAPAELAMAEAAAPAAAEPMTGAVEVEALAFAAAPPEAAPLALSAASVADQAPAQNVDPLAAARTVVQPAGESGRGPAAAAMAAPAGAAAPLPTPLPPATVLPTATSAPTQTPTTAPTATPTTMPTALPAPTAAGVALEQAAPEARTLPAAPIQPQPAPQPAALPWFTIAQVVAGAGFLLFGLLWWRSRR